MRQILSSLEHEKETGLSKIKKEINLLVTLLRNRSIAYFRENSDFAYSFQNDFVNKIINELI